MTGTARPGRYLDAKSRIRLELAFAFYVKRSLSCHNASR